VSVRQTGDYSVVATQHLGYPASTVAFHPKEPVVLIGTDVLRDTEGLVRRYDIGKKRWDDILDTRKVAGVEVEIPGVYGLEFSPDGTRLAVLTRSTVLLLDWKSQKVVHTITQQGKHLYQSLHYSRDGNRLVLSDYNRTFWVYDTTTWAGQAVVIPDDEQMGPFCVTRDGKYVCAVIFTPDGSKYQGRWAVYSFPDIKPLAYVTAHVGTIQRIVADPKENKVLTGGGDGKIMLWSLDDVLKPKK
jgi:WD40 repeat protein